METEYIIIPKNTIESYKISSEHTLTQEEVAKLVVNSKLIAKFIQQKAISIQFDIWMGLVENIDVELKVVKRLWEISKEILNIKQVYEEYVKELNENKE